MTNLPQDKSTKDISGIVSSGSNPAGVIYIDSESDITSIVSKLRSCLLYTSDAADERSSVDLGGRRIIKKKKKREKE